MKAKYERKENLKILSAVESRVVENYILANGYGRSTHPKFSSLAVTNHIPQNSLIGNKKALFHSLYYYYKHVAE